MAKLSMEADGRELQIAEGSHLYVKDKEEAIYWEWEKIAVIHKELQQILRGEEHLLDKVKELLPKLPKNEIK